MTDQERQIIAWFAVLVVTFGMFFLFLWMRAWCARRARQDPLELPNDDSGCGHEYPMTRFSLRRSK